MKSHAINSVNELVLWIFNLLKFDVKLIIEKWISMTEHKEFRYKQINKAMWWEHVASGNFR